MTPITYRIVGNQIAIRYRNKKFNCQLLGMLPHSDHILLTALLGFDPQIKSTDELSFPYPISDKMKEALIQIGYAKITTQGICEPHKGTIAGLSYSGGIDSSAAATILPPGVALYLNRGTLFDPYATKALHKLREKGWYAYSVACNVEHLRTPVGFPTDIACAAPCIINAKHFNLDSTAFGTVLESAYSIGRLAYRNYKTNAHYIRWGTLLDAAGLPFNQVTAGLSEVATYTIFKQSGLIGKSCLRHISGNCNKCYKCYRRALLDGKQLPLSKETEIKIAKKHHVNILQYANEKYGFTNIKTNLSCLEKFYTPAIELLPLKYQQVVQDNILKYLKPMTEEDILRIQTYKLQPGL